MIWYHVGDVCKKCNHPMLLTKGDVGSKVPWPFVKKIKKMYYTCSSYICNTCVYPTHVLHM